MGFRLSLGQGIALCRRGGASGERAPPMFGCKRPPEGARDFLRSRPVPNSNCAPSKDQCDTVSALSHVQTRFPLSGVTVTESGSM